MPGIFGIGGHLGSAVSALVDGQLDEVAEERAWRHVEICPTCRREVEREGWTKRRLSLMAGGEPSSRLLDSLFELEAPTRASEAAPTRDQVRDSWAAVDHLERQGRGRRRTGIAAVGVGSVSAAVLGLSTLSGATLGIGSAPSGPPATSLTRPASSPSPSSLSSWLPAPAASRYPGWLPTRSTGGSVPVPVLAPR